MSGINDEMSIAISGDDSQVTLSGRLKCAGTVRAKVDAIIPAGTVDEMITVAFPAASLDSIQVWSDKNCTVKFNDPIAPTLIINLVANWPFLWNSGDGYYPNPFTQDVSQIYVTTPGPAVNLILKALSG